MNSSYLDFGAEWSTVRLFGDLLAFLDSVYHSTKVSCGTETVGYGSICHVAGGDKVNISSQSMLYCFLYLWSAKYNVFSITLHYELVMHIKLNNIL